MGDVAATVVGDYILGERLGGGGFGEVFAATHRVIGGEAAIKILHAYRCADPVAVGRFMIEARAVNKVRHAGIVDVFAFGELPDGRHYYVMERLRGQTLRTLLDERKRLPLAEALPLLRKIADAVDAAHAAGITHRDLKPDNIFVAPDGAITLIDFGIAKLSTEATMTETDSLLGTPAYMSPEQCRGGVVDESSDRYSFGALAYHMLVGTPPFEGDPLGLALQHLNDKPERPSKRAKLSTAVDAPILALLDKDPSRRPRPLVNVVESIAEPAPFPWRRAMWGVAAFVMLVAAAVTVKVLETPAPPLVIDGTKVSVNRIPADGVINNVIWVTPDGRHIRYSDRNYGIEQSLDDGSVRSINFVFPTTDSGRQLAMGSYTQLAAPGSPIESVVDGEWPTPCGDKIALIAVARLIVLDENTLVRTDLGEAPGVWGMNWSPNCRRLLWTSADRILHLTDVVTRVTTTLDLPMAARANVYMGAAFVGDEAIVYCKDVPGRVDATLHYLDGRAPDLSLFPLSADVDTCRVASTPSGRRVVVEAFQQPTSSVVATTAIPSIVVPSPVLEKNELVEQFVDDTTWVVTRTEGRPLDPLAPASRPHRGSSRLVTARGSTPLKACPGESAIIHRADKLVRVVLDRTALTLLDGDSCQPVATWSLPPLAATWSRPSCVGMKCVIAALDRRVHLYELEATGGVRTILEFDSSIAARDSIPVEQVALSPDAKTVVMLKAATPTFDVIDLETRSRRSLDFGVGIGPALEYPIWADNTHVYFGANGLDWASNDEPDGIFKFDLEGNFERMLLLPWYSTLSAVSPSGNVMSIRRNAATVDQIVIDMPAFTR